MERSVGEIFNYKEIKLEVKEAEKKNCENCSFLKEKNCGDISILGECSGGYRTDKKEVIFVETEESKNERSNGKRVFRKWYWI